MANETLKACCGRKSYSTLLKRAGTLKRFILWHKDHYFERGFSVDAIPLHEPDVWNYVRHLTESRESLESAMHVVHWTCHFP